MMKVLLISNDFPPLPFGVSRWYERICAAVPPDRVVVLAPRVQGDLAFDAKQPYRIVRRRVPMSRHPLMRLIQMTMFCAHAIPLICSERIDAIHIGQLHLGPVGIALRILFHVPYVLHVHGGEMAAYMRFRAFRAVIRAIVRHAHTMVVNCPNTIHSYETLNMRSPRSEVLTFNVQTDRFRPDLDGRQIRAKYGLDGHKVILTVARLDDYKGHDMVIRALNSVKASVGPVRYLIVGFGRGREEERLRKLAREMGCAEDVVFAGFAQESDLPAFYAACDVFIMVSRTRPDGDFEGFGIVFLEANACAKPVVGGRSGGIPYAVIDGVTGILVDPTDVGQIGDALSRLLANREEAAQFGMAGRRRTEELGRAWTTAVRRLWWAT